MFQTKKKIREEVSKEVENKVGDRKKVVSKRILKIVRIVVAYLYSIDGREKMEIEKVVEETSKL